MSTSRSVREVQVADIVPRSRVLGPGTRMVIWVQGCPLRCAGCISPQWLPEDGGQVVPIADLAQKILDDPGLDGVTFSGGEPFAQAGGLVRLIDVVRRTRDLSFMSYSGFELSALESGDLDQRRLLDRLDLLIDGRYVREEHTDALWRASANQKIHRLSSRHDDDSFEGGTAGLEFEVHDDHSLTWTGVPSVPGFVPLLDRVLRHG